MAGFHCTRYELLLFKKARQKNTNAVFLQIINDNYFQEI